MDYNLGFLCWFCCDLSFLNFYPFMYLFLIGLVSFCLGEM